MVARILSRLVHPTDFSGWIPYLSHWKTRDMTWVSGMNHQVERDGFASNVTFMMIFTGDFWWVIMIYRDLCWIGICVAPNLMCCWLSPNSTSFPDPNPQVSLAYFDRLMEKSTDFVFQSKSMGITFEHLPLNRSNICRFGDKKEDSIICST